MRIATIAATAALLLSATVAPALAQTADPPDTLTNINSRALRNIKQVCPKTPATSLTCQQEFRELRIEVLSLELDGERMALMSVATGSNGNAVSETIFRKFRTDFTRVTKEEERLNAKYPAR